MRSIEMYKYPDISIPVIGLGTYGRDAQTLGRLIEGIDADILMLDTASRYENEDEVGRAIKKSGFKRDRLMIIGKMSRKQSYEVSAGDALMMSMKKLGVNYLDAYLLHSPRLKNIPILFSELIQLKKEGFIKYIGVSGFSADMIHQLYTFCGCYPDINQIVLPASNSDYSILDEMKKLGVIPLVAQPFGGIVLSDSARKNILINYAKEYIPLIIGTQKVKHFIQNLEYIKL